MGFLNKVLHRRFMTPRHRKRNKLAELYVTVMSINHRLAVALGAPSAFSAFRRSFYMPSIDEALEAVRAASSRTDSIIADRASLKQQLADALSGVTLPPEVQTKIDAIFDIETSDAKKIDDALNENVPPPDNA